MAKAKSSNQSGFMTPGEYQKYRREVAVESKRAETIARDFMTCVRADGVLARVVDPLNEATTLFCSAKHQFETVGAFGEEVSRIVEKRIRRASHG